MTENFRKFLSEFTAKVEQEKATMKIKYSVEDIDEMMALIEYFLDTDPSNYEAINKINSGLESLRDSCLWGYYDGPSVFFIDEKTEGKIMAKELSHFASKMKNKVNEYMSYAINSY